MKLADVEAALAANRTPEVLAVYGDALQALGDPRGELIAIDLHVAAHGPSAELAARKRELIDHWLGAELAARLPMLGTVDCGFIEIPWGVLPSDIDDLLAHPGTRGALRTLAIEGSDPDLHRSIDLLCATPPPWLEILHIVRYPDGLDPAVRDTIAIDDDRARRLVRETPRLRRLTLAGANVFGELVHPGVTALRVYNYDSLRGLLDAGPPLALAELDLQLGDTPSDNVLAAMLPRSRVPALRRLDLARNEALWRDPAFVLVATNPVVRQLAWLRVPSIRCDAHLDAAELAAVGATEVVVSRAHANHQPTRAPSARLRMPPVRPWPPADADVHRLTIVVPGAPGAITFEVSQALDLMEARFDALADAERATWIELWRGVHALSPAGFRIAVRALERALDACGFLGGHDSLAALLNALRECTADTVEVRPWSLWA